MLCFPQRTQPALFGTHRHARRCGPLSCISHQSSYHATTITTNIICIIYHSKQSWCPTRSLTYPARRRTKCHSTITPYAIIILRSHLRLINKISSSANSLVDISGARGSNTNTKISRSCQEIPRVAPLGGRRITRIKIPSGQRFLYPRHTPQRSSCPTSYVDL